MTQVDDANRPTVLVVDDSAKSLAQISNVLKDDYRIQSAGGGAAAMQLMQGKNLPDLILLAVTMPAPAGLEVCRRLRADPLTQGVPVILLVDQDERQDESMGLAAGAQDYMTKPVNPGLLKARVATQLALRSGSDFLSNQAAFLEAEVKRRIEQAEAAQDATVLAISMLAETRDMDTGNHIRRTQRYVKVLAKHLLNHQRFSEVLSPQIIDQLFKSAPLHDIGNVGIPDRILLKPGRLTAEEFEFMKTHTSIGYNSIVQAEAAVGVAVPYLHLAKEIIHSHHERWDGSGYPQGLAGDAIPVSARLMAVADVYDALISTRVYKVGLPHDRAVQEIFQGRGTHFDPDMVDAFIEIQDEFSAIAVQFGDDEALLQKKMEYMAQAIAEDA